MLKNLYPTSSSLMQNLQNLVDRTGYELTQVNGQRIYSVPSCWKLPEPPKGSEVFIGKLHRNLFEDELVPLFESIGPLYRFRLMLDFSEKTRGYAFATYFTPEHAEQAISLLNNYEIRPRLHIGVYKSLNNCRLFFGNLPKNRTKEEVEAMVKSYVGGVKEVIMYKSAFDPNLSRGFAFVEFLTHRDAAMARRQFTPKNLHVWGKTLYVDWADPVPEVDKHIMANVTILYVKELPLNCSSEELKRILYAYCDSKQIKKVHKYQNYAFVHFASRRAAEVAFVQLKDLTVRGKMVEVEWARPREYSKKNRMQYVPNHFCTAVPPYIRKQIREKKSTSEGSTSSSQSKTPPMNFPQNSFFSDSDFIFDNNNFDIFNEFRLNNFSKLLF